MRQCHDVSGESPDAPVSMTRYPLFGYRCGLQYLPQQCHPPAYLAANGESICREAQQEAAKNNLAEACKAFYG